MFEPARVVVIVTQQIGDVLLTTPLLAAARMRWPHARIDVLGFAGTLGMLNGNPDVNGLLEVGRERGWRAWRVLGRLWRRYDLALVTQAGDRAHLYGWVAARTRSALIPRERSIAWWKRALAQYAFPGVPDLHSVLEKLQLLSPWMDLAAYPVAVVPPPATALPTDIDAQLRSPLVVVHVPSMRHYKQWPVAHFRVVIAALLADGAQVVLTGAASASDQALISDVRGLGNAPALLDASGRLDFNQLVTLLARADAYLGPDTSITHLAAAVGAPVVTLYGPTRPPAWGPWPEAHAATQPWQLRGAEPLRVQRQGRIVLMQGPSRTGDDCVPCGRAGCEDRLDSRSECLEGLAPDRVLAELRLLLKQARQDGAKRSTDRRGR